MDALTSLGDAFISTCYPTSLLLMVAGVAVGIIFGSILGLSVAMVVALLLPLTLSMMPSTGMNLLVVAYIGGISGGPISAILLGVPGIALSITICFDVRPMAKNGKAGRAFGYGIVFSFLDFAFSFLVFIFCALLLAGIVLKFTPAENFGVSFFALTMVTALASGSVVEGVSAGMLELILTLVGMAPTDGTPRFTFGNSSLMAGFDIPPALIGAFAISEILITTESMGNNEVEVMKMKPVKGFGSTWKEFIYQIPNAIRSILMGIGIGTLPDTDGSTPGMLSYMVIKNTSKHPDEFGKGCPGGIVATETTNNATISGAMIPLLALDIPGDGVATMMLGGLLIHSPSAGPLFFVKNADVMYDILAACMLCSPFMLIIKFLGIKGSVQLLRTPKHILMPLILALCCVGAYAINDRIFDVQPIILSRAVGYLYHKLKLPTMPFVFCFLIGEMVEIYLQHGTMQYKSFGAPFRRPIFDVFFLVAITVVVWFIYREWRMTKAKEIQHVLRRDK